MWENWCNTGRLSFKAAYKMRLSGICDPRLFNYRLHILESLELSTNNFECSSTSYTINWLDNSDSGCRIVFNILEKFGLVQRIELPTYQNGNILYFISTRQSSDFESNFMVSNKISDTWRYMHHYYVSALILRGTKCLFELYAV